MNKISKLLNFVYLSVLMFIVVSLLLYSFVRDYFISFFEKKRSTHKVKSKAVKTKQKSSRYIIHQKAKITT